MKCLRFQGPQDRARHFGGSPRQPKVEQVQPAPKEEDKAVQEAAAEALRRKKTKQGYRSTVLSNTMLSDDTVRQLQTMGS